MKTTKKAAVVVNPGIKRTVTAVAFIEGPADRLAQAVRKNFENNTAAILATGNDDLVEAMEDYRSERDEVIGASEVDLSIVEEKEK